MSLKVYIAGPYTQGDPVMNVRAAVKAADIVMSFGHVPFVPHLTHLWHLISPKGYEQWMTWDMEWLAVCRHLIRLPGDSAGADREVAEAFRLGIPVHRGLERFAAACLKGEVL